MLLNSQMVQDNRLETLIPARRDRDIHEIAIEQRVAYSETVDKPPPPLRRGSLPTTSCPCLSRRAVDGPDSTAPSTLPPEGGVPRNTPATASVPPTNCAAPTASPTSTENPNPTTGIKGRPSLPTRRSEER